jgi:hypothetical protein
MRPFYEIAPFSNNVKYNINQLIFLVADNDEGTISEYSESCRKLLNFNNEIEHDDIVKKIGEFVIDLNF